MQILVDSLTTFIPFVICRDFDDHRCCAENRVVTSLTEANWTFRWGLATRDTAVSSYPTHYSAHSHEDGTVV